MSDRKTLNSRVPDQRSPSSGRELNSGRVDDSQLEAHSPKHERGDERRDPGGPGKSQRSNTPSQREQRRQHEEHS